MTLKIEETNAKIDKNGTKNWQKWHEKLTKMRQKIDKNETENDQNGAQKVSQTDKKMAEKTSLATQKWRKKVDFPKPSVGWCFRKNFDILFQTFQFFSRNWAPQVPAKCQIWAPPVLPKCQILSPKRQTLTEK